MESAPARRDCQAIILIKLFCTKKRGCETKERRAREASEQDGIRGISSSLFSWFHNAGCRSGPLTERRAAAAAVQHGGSGQGGRFGVTSGRTPLSGTLERKFLCGENGAWERGKGGKGRSGLPSRENSGSLADALFCRIVFFSSSRGSCVKTARQWNDAVVPNPVPCSALGGRAGVERLGQPPGASGERVAFRANRCREKDSRRAPCPTGKRRNKVHFFLFLRRGGGKMD